jgi:hypothetical protein
MVASLSSLLGQQKRSLTDTPSPARKRQQKGMQDHGYHREPPMLHVKTARQGLFAAHGTSEIVDLNAKESLIREMSCQMDSLCCLSESGSILYGEPSPNMCVSIFEELRKRVPLLFEVLSVAAWPVKQVEKPDLVCVIYAMLMQARSQRCNALQKQLTALCIRYNANNQVPIPFSILSIVLMCIVQW